MITVRVEQVRKSFVLRFTAKSAKDRQELAKIRLKDEFGVSSTQEEPPPGGTIEVVLVRTQN